MNIGTADHASVEVELDNASERHRHYRPSLRIPSSASTRAGIVIELMNERRRANCVAMRSQF